VIAVFAAIVKTVRSTRLPIAESGRALALFIVVGCALIGD